MLFGRIAKSYGCAGTHVRNLTTCQQDVFATCLQQACQQVVTMLLFYQIATRLSFTTSQPDVFATGL